MESVLAGICADSHTILHASSAVAMGNLFSYVHMRHYVSVCDAQVSRD